MEIVIINGKIKEKKKSEFFHTTESLKHSVNKYCKDLKINIDSDNNLNIRIVFEDKYQLENFYNRTEFDILKGSVKSLCDDIIIKINDKSLTN
jgi:hypothetical protein